MLTRPQHEKWLVSVPTALLFVLLFSTYPFRIEASSPWDSVEPPDTSRWLCTLCPFRDGWSGTLDVGPGYVNGSSNRYADYRGLYEKGAFAAVNGEAHFRDDADRYVDIYIDRLGLDSRSITARGGTRGRYQLRLSYREIPRYRGYGTATVYTGTGTGHLGLPDNWQKAPTTDGMSSLESSLTPTSLETLRKTLEGGLSWKLASRWKADMDVTHETKDGSRPFGAGLFTINTSQFPVPVVYRTDRLDLGLQYSTQKARVRFGFAGSWFDNGATSITWENPFSSAPEFNLLRASLPPDNEFYQFTLQGAFAPRPGVRLSGRASLGRMRQNDPLLPYTINPEYQQLNLPRDSADLRIDTGVLNIAGSLFARLASRLDLSANVKFDQRENHSPVDIWTIILTDFIPGGERSNRPYNFERAQYRLELNYRATRPVTLRAGATQENYERTLQSVRKTDERLYWGEVYFNQWSAGQLRLRLETANRDASPYQQVDETGLIENPLMRKFNYANRDSDRAIIELNLFPSAAWSVNLSWSRTQADYTESRVGLQQSEEENFSIDAGMSLGRGISLAVYASRDDISSILSGFEQGVQTPWSGYTDDRTSTFGLSFSGKASKSLTWSLDWTHANSTGEISVVSGPGDAPFPDLRTRFGNLRAQLNYAINPRWGLAFTVEYESLSTSNWQIDGIGPAGISNVLTLGNISPRYYITQVRTQASYRF